MCSCRKCTERIPSNTRFRSKHQSSSFWPFDGTVFDIGTIFVLGNASKGTHLFCLHGTGSSACTRVITAIASGDSCVIEPDERSVDGSKTLHLFTSMGSPSGTCFITNIIAFHESPIEWKSVRLRLRRTKYMSRGIAWKKPVILGYCTGRGEAAGHRRGPSLLVADSCCVHKPALKRHRAAL